MGTSAVSDHVDVTCLYLLVQGRLYGFGVPIAYMR